MGKLDVIVSLISPTYLPQVAAYNFLHDAYVEFLATPNGERLLSELGVTCIKDANVVVKNDDDYADMW